MTEETKTETTEEDSENLSEGTLLSHLIELRGRLLKISVAVVAVFAFHNGNGLRIETM